jgi:hypothetical protein
LHLLPITDLLAGHAIDGGPDAVEDDDRTLGILQDGLVVLAELLAGFEIEVLAGLLAPFDLALAVVVELDPALELVKERVGVLGRLGLAGAGLAVVVQHLCPAVNFVMTRCALVAVETPA